MGIPLVKSLSLYNRVFVTSRKEHESCHNVQYIVGNATQRVFLESVLKMYRWNAVVDFMVHTEEALREILPLLLDNTDQYVFISSARVYSESNVPITEKTPRLLDVSQDKEYLKTNEYALAKAREENLLLNSGRKNFTIIRPSITYNTYRFQLGVLEKENWLYRALHGRSIVFSYDINDKITTNTWGGDVSYGIASIIGNKQALGEIFNITCPWSMPWNDILDIYVKVLKEYFGDNRNIPVVMTQKSTNLKFPRRIYQVIYCRYFNRSFDNTKLNYFCDTTKFKTPENGIKECLMEFLKSPKFLNIDWVLEAVNDRVAGEYTPLSEITGVSAKVDYLLYRFNLGFFSMSIKKMVMVLRKIKLAFTRC